MISLESLPIDVRFSGDVGCRCRHLITCEFPPQLGGVADYTNLLARELAAAGDEVHVWCPGASLPESETEFAVHRDLGRVSIANLARVDRSLNKFGSPNQIIVQWVPHGYGYKSLNLPFCMGLWKRAKLNGDSIEVMIHEPFLTFTEGGWKQFAAACIHRLMIVFLLSAASKVWLSTSAWEARVRPYRLGRDIPLETLPIFSNIPVESDKHRVAEIRAKYCDESSVLIGHFGTHGPKVSQMLGSLIPLLFKSPRNLKLLFMGPGSRELAAQHPEWDSRVSATGSLTAAEVSLHLQACDLIIQPYPDGITTRRGSSMASLAHGRPMVSTFGALTEPFWRQEPGVVLESAYDMAAMAHSIIKLADDSLERRRLGREALSLYNSRFHISRTVAAVRQAQCAQVV